MPVLARDARVGDVLKTSKNATGCLSCLVMLWEKTYVVMRKDASGFSVWLNDVTDMLLDKDRGWVDKKSLEPNNYRHWDLGVYQVRGDTLLFYLSDDKPTDSSRVIRPSDEEAEGPKRSRGGPDTLYKFSFDDEDVDISDMPRQALVLADLLHSTGKIEFTELEIENIVSTPEAITEFKSKQSPMTIFRFYRSEFSKRGFINRK